MTKQRLQEILYSAVVMLERDLQSYHSDEEAHNMLLEDIGITEKEYKQIMKEGANND